MRGGRLLLVAVLAALGGAGIGVLLAALGRDDTTVSSAPATRGATTATSAAATPGVAQTTTRTRSAPSTTTARSATTTATTRPAAPTATTPRKRTARIRAVVVSAVLHPAATAAGRRRSRARVTVRVRVENRGASQYVPQRPVLIVAGRRVHADGNAPAASRLGPLPAGARVDVRLRFEIAGEVTRALTTQRTARIRVSGHELPVAIKVVDPVSRSAGP